MSQSPLAAEWAVLQNQYDSYEKFSLLIKLLAIAVLATTVVSGSARLLIPAILLVLWLQDAIWKSFQGRIATRLLQLERCLADRDGPTSSHHEPYQYNSQFAENRPGTVALIAEYLQQTLRPTVAYPYLVLVLLALLNAC